MKRSLLWSVDFPETAFNTSKRSFLFSSHFVQLESMQISICINAGLFNECAQNTMGTALNQLLKPQGSEELG